MKAHCPHCGTTYAIEKKLLREARGLARCFNCGNVFDALTNSDEAPGTRDDDLPRDPLAAHENTRLSKHRHGKESTLPFDVPDDLPALQAADSIALNAQDTLHPAARHSARWWQKALVLLLIILLALQLAWLRRDLWVHLPMAVQLCAWLECKPPAQVRPDLFKVVERDMQALPGTPHALRLYLSFRNDADFSQPLPRLQLSLLDSNGTLVARRLLRADQYLPTSWAGPPVATPQEVVTIELMLEDPGPRVRGFVFDFL